MIVLKLTYKSIKRNIERVYIVYLVMFHLSPHLSSVLAVFLIFTGFSLERRRQKAMLFTIFVLRNTGIEIGNITFNMNNIKM